MSECSTSTTVGETLIQSLNEMVADGSMTEAAANAIQVSYPCIYVANVAVDTVPFFSSLFNMDFYLCKYFYYFI